MDAKLQTWVDEAAARCPTLAAKGFGDLAGVAREATVTWRWSRSESGVHRPEPFAVERRGSRGGWLGEPPEYGSVDRVGFDEAGRPTVVVSWFEGRESRVVEVWEHQAGRSVGLWRLDDTVGQAPRASVTILDDLTRPTVVIGAKQGWTTVDGAPLVEVSLERWTWENGRIARGELRPSSAGGDWQAAGGGSTTFLFFGDDEVDLEGEPAVVEPTYDADGTLVGLVVDDRPIFGEAAEAAAEARSRAWDERRAEEARLREEASKLPADVHTDRAALTALLTAEGVTDAEVIVGDFAAVALRLEDRDGSDGEPLPRTRLYGRKGLLPPGEPWPHSRGRALGFLAAIDLSELPRDLLDTRNPLPAAGWLLFYADLDTADEDGGTFLGEGYPNAESEPSRVFWVEPGQEPVETDPPPLRAKSAVFPERRCAVVPQLQLPAFWDVREALGIPQDQDDAYSEVAHGLPPWGSDFVLGTPTDTQGNGPEAGEAVLLHLGSVEFQDGGDVQFRMPASALLAGDWSQIGGYGASG